MRIISDTFQLFYISGLQQQTTKRGRQKVSFEPDSHSPSASIDVKPGYLLAYMVATSSQSQSSVTGDTTGGVGSETALLSMRKTKTPSTIYESEEDQLDSSKFKKSDKGEVNMFPNIQAVYVTPVEVLLSITPTSLDVTQLKVSANNTVNVVVNSTMLDHEKNQVIQVCMKCEIVKLFYISVYLWVRGLMAINVGCKFCDCVPNYGC